MKFFFTLVLGLMPFCISLAQLPIPGVTTGQSNNYFKAGTGDGGSITTYNSYLQLHNGLAIGSPFVSNGAGGYVEKATIAFRARTGDITTSGKLSVGSGAEPKNALDVMGGFDTNSETQLFVGQDHNFGANTGRYGIGLSLRHVDGTSLGKMGYLNIWSGNVQRRVMAFDYLGRVGIGTSVPDATLAVKGTIHANEVVVDLNVPGPDYVFDQSYKLMSLDEVKEYIRRNSHLPEIPSASDMEQNGIDLGTMNMLLLKKIEELTLYVIDQERLNKIQVEKADQLEARIEILERMISSGVQSER